VTRRPRTPRGAGRNELAAAALLVLSLTTLAALCLAERYPMADLSVYRAEGDAVLDGRALYGFTVTPWRLPATYPPFAAVLFVPVAWLPPAVAKCCSLAGNAALLALLVHLSLRLVRHPGPRRTAVLLAATAVGLWLEPVFQTLVYGQINLLLVCLVLWDLTRPDGARGKGLAIGLAAGIKLTPAVFAVHLLLTGRVRAGLTALAGFVGTISVGACLLPSASWEFFTRRVFDTDRVGKAWIVDNQSLQGLAARLAHTTEPGPLWLLPAAVLAVAGLLLARRLHAGGRPDRSVLVTAFTALLISPISWSHHWVWCVPLLLVALREARPYALLALAAVFTARSFWLVPKQGNGDLRLTWWQQPFASPYPLTALALLAVAAATALAAVVATRAYSASASGSASGSSLPASRSWESTIR
jgi:alpha-1,2-mannosyltransferase